MKPLNDVCVLVSQKHICHNVSSDVNAGVSGNYGAVGVILAEITFHVHAICIENIAKS